MASSMDTVLRGLYLDFRFEAIFSIMDLTKLNIYCTFDEPCHGLKLKAGTRKFKLRKSLTPTHSTGCSGDHTSGSGHYYYLEAINKPTDSRHGLITTHTFPVGHKICVEFWFHMYGSDIGSLYIEIKENNVVSPKKVAGGPQGDSWTTFRIRIVPKHSDALIAIVGYAGSGPYGDICIDDVAIFTDHKLSQTPISTSVESQASDCAVKCMQISNCRSFNFGPSGQCELLGSFVCDSADIISPFPGFRHYDIENERLDERLHQMRNTSACLSNGRCSPKCGKSIGTNCTIHAECMAIDLSSSCRDGFCSCLVGFAYNVTTSICDEENVVVTTTATTTTIPSTTTTPPASSSTPLTTQSLNITTETASATSVTTHVTNTSNQTPDPNASTTTAVPTSTPDATITDPAANTTTQAATTTAPAANTTSQAATTDPASNMTSQAATTTASAANTTLQAANTTAPTSTTPA
ncbi:MAM and LDL-receptor class A domain-containing protein 1-like [Pecten maximus]|uniref:MAM and LDL-receptor class A domain-containing protein 1-like n=1 Tax=Pecten maximus TaxID=6579 RepID=UPI001457E7C7|nr:MAM and LDL-receptor class A domain-containing protein 1-like [Pecten maximus]